jgi:serine/threonine protein kinase
MPQKLKADLGFFKSFKADSLRALSNNYSNVEERFGQDSVVPFDPHVDKFIENYQMLPLAARAKLENWSINAEEIKLITKVDTESAMFDATYRGLQVSARVHTNEIDQACEDESLHNEVRAMAQLRHPNIVSFLGASLSSKDCIIVTELTGPGNLRSFYISKEAHKRNWRPTSGQALSWALDLARAVTYLHQSDPAVTHRDLRPETLLIAASGALKVSGFGRCKMHTGQEESCLSRTASSEAAVSPRRTTSCHSAIDSLPHPPIAAPRQRAARRPISAAGPYVAPELLRDGACADAGVDIFAAAMVMRFLHTGRDPPPQQHSPAPAPEGRLVAQDSFSLPARAPDPAIPAPVPVSCLASAAAALRGRGGGALCEPGADPGGRAGARQLGWGAAGGVVARAEAAEAAERPGAQELLEALEAEAGRRTVCRLA